MGGQPLPPKDATEQAALRSMGALAKDFCLSKDKKIDALENLITHAYEWIDIVNEGN